MEPINNFYMVRIGIAEASASGDFLENMHETVWLSIADAGEDNNILLIFHPNLGLMIHKNKQFTDIHKALAKKINSSSLNLNDKFLAAVLQSTFENDLDGILSYNEELESKTFQANETDSVNEFTPCVFGIGSSSFGIDNARINTSTKKIWYEDEEVENLSLLYGKFDEDETWVLGIRRDR